MDDDVKQRNVLAAALGFATRLPTSWLGTPDAESFGRARALLPTVGILVGTLGALATRGVYALLHDATIAAIAGVATTVAVTGALHEDGLADVCDGIGGGGDRERVLAIFRDSRLGSFGVLALVLSVSARIALVAYLLTHGAPLFALSGLVASHVVARSAATFVGDRFPSARPADERASAAFVVRPFDAKERALYVAPALLVAAFASDGFGMLAALVVVALGVALAAGAAFERWLGGVTGDCLGAIEQLVELAVLFVAAVGAVR